MEISNKVKDHLKRLYDKEAFGDEVNYDQLLENWEAKERLFEGQLNNLNMEEVSLLQGDVPRALLGISYSGSLLALYVPNKGKRILEYASIKFRDDVPGWIKDEAVVVKDSIEQDKAVYFSQGKLEHSSPLYRLAALPLNLSAAEQDRRLSEAMIYLSNGFMKLNLNTFHPNDPAPEHFTKRNMVAFLGKKFGLTQQMTKDIIEDYPTLVETGILMGESISLGRIGRLKLKTKSPQKARIIKSPQDGSEITVPAKPAIMVPKISFSDYFKDRSATVPVEE
jgi:nucleoid DNA-binding protein